MALTLEEEIFISSGLLEDNYDPAAELEEGDEHLTPEEQKTELAAAKEEYLAVRGRLSKLSREDGKWEVGGDFPSDKSLRIRYIFASVRKSRQEISTPEGEKLQDGLPTAYAVGDVRVYVEPKTMGPGDSFKRITINLLVPTPMSLTEPMTRETFVDEVADEIRFQLRVECWNCSKPVEHDADECPSCEADLLDDETEEPEEGTETEAIDTTGTPVEPEASPSPVGSP